MIMFKKRENYHTFGWKNVIIYTFYPPSQVVILKHMEQNKSKNTNKS